MKFKVIDSERLSIYLTQDELEIQRIDAELLKEPEQLRRFLVKAGEESGFSVEGSALEVEIIPILDGDLLVSVKKVEGIPEKIVRHIVFKDTEELICACGLLKNVYSGKSDLYLYGGAYHMILKSPELNMRTDAIIREFGYATDNISEAVLKEHGKVICEQKCIEMFTKNFLNN